MTSTDGARWIALSRGEFALIDETDYEAVSQFKWCLHKGPANKTPYAKCYMKTGQYTKRGTATGRYAGRYIYLHQFIWRRMGKEKTLIDHRDRNGLNNRRANLRAATGRQNKGNVALYSTNTSGYRGVSWSKQKGKWVASISCRPRRIHLGFFEDKEEAAHAYDKAATGYFGEEYAFLNFPDA